MKRIVTISLIIACVFTVIPAKAQFKWGLKGGVNVSKLSFNKDILKSENMEGFFVGPIVEFTIPLVGLGVDAALLYNQLGMKSNVYRYKKMGLDIPINLKYTLGLGSIFGIFIAAGPNFFFNFKGDNNIINKRRVVVGINLGAGVKLINHLQLGANYNIPLGISGESNSADKYNYRVRTWQISIAYLF